MPTYAAWVAWIERHHRTICLASALLGLLCTAALTRLRLDIEILGMLPQGRPAFDQFRAFVADFGELDQLFVLVEGGEPERFAQEMAPRLRALDTVEQVLERVDVDRLLSGLLGRRLFHYVPDDAWDEVSARLAPAAIDRRVAANRAILAAPFDLGTAQAIAQDPLGLRELAARSLTGSYGGAAPSLSNGYFTSTDGSALLLFVRARGSAFDVIFAERLLQQVRAAEAETRRELGAAAAPVRVAYTGSYVYALEDKQTLRADILRYTVLSLVGVLAVFWLGFRNFRILPFVTYPLLLTTLIAFALSLLLYDQLNVVSLCFAAILYGLSIDSAIHFYTRLLEERRRQPDLAGAMTATLAGLARPTVAAAATTAAAFLVVGLSVLGAVSQMGVLTAIGMAASTACFFVLYPALSFLLPGSSEPRLAPPDTPRLGRVAAWSGAHRGAIAAATAAAAVALGLLATGLRLDAGLDHLRPRDSEAVRVQDEIVRRFGDPGGRGAVVVRRADLDQALADAEEIAARLRRYREEGRIGAVRSVDGALPSARAQRARMARFEALPRAESADTLRAALARHGFSAARFEGFLATLEGARPGEADLVRLGDPDLEPLASLIGHHVRRHGEESIVAVYFDPPEGTGLAGIEEQLRRDLPGVELGVASRLLLESELADVLRRELFWFCLFGVAGNLALLLFLYRDPRFAAALLVPMVLVVTALFALMAVAGIAIDPVNLVVTPLLFGIGVDYGVYVGTRARDCGSAERALTLSGRALVVTALTTVAGFGFLGLSRYPFLASLGLLAGIGLLLSLVLAVVVLPALLRPGAGGSPP